MTLRFSKKTIRGISATLALVMITDMFRPLAVYALTGGPSQPEVQSFTPIGTTDMVDLFSGDFSYNIPLLDMDGYPINLAYHAGSSMDEEASWVGLGWNINPGTINRNMRGLPDDFSGDQVLKEFNMKPDRTFGLNAGFGTEIFGKSDTSHIGLSLNLGFSIGANYNNYSGIGIEKSFNVGLSAGKYSKLPWNTGLGITSSSQNGLTIQPHAGFSSRNYKGIQHDEAAVVAGIEVGTAFNSRSGLKQLTINSSMHDKSNFSKRLGLGTKSTFDFGSYTYTPSVNLPMQNFSLSGNFKFGGELFGLHGNYTLGGYYSAQKLITNSQSNRAYGYLHYGAGAQNPNAMLDFNRENDRAYVTDLPALSMASLTYDTYSVSGQGVGGSYRPSRSDIGYVFDPFNYSTSDGYSIGGEVGAGNTVHVGADISVNASVTYSGAWHDDNLADNRLTFSDAVASDNEPVYFREANEKAVESDPSFYNVFGNSNPQRFKLNHNSKFNTDLSSTLVDQHNTPTNLPASNKRSKRDKRNLVIYPLTRAEVNNGFGLEDPRTDAYNAPGHHIAEITTYGNDGMRYVYGLPAYNKYQEEVSFAVGKDLNGDGGAVTTCSSGQVLYSSDADTLKGDNSIGNERGIDHYFNRVRTPAYAHSYLLTAVLSPDYVDADTVKGPSIGDLGYYTKFHYAKVDNYAWRTPMEHNEASWNEGLKSDETDDRGSYVAGKKEIWYLDTIISKNYLAVFTTEARKDGFGVIEHNGGIDTDPAKAMRLLRKISLYSLHDVTVNGVNAVPIKEVHFEYDYSLCGGVPNNSGVSEVHNSINVNAAEGKLTLKKIYFTYRNSNRARLSPYEFVYSGGQKNPAYSAKAYDRWGHYKPNGSVCGVFDPLTTAEYPYVTQDKVEADTLASAWTLRQIKLPSGGKIDITYESDDYAYVQNLKAMQMCKIIGTEDNSGGVSTGGSPVDKSISDPTKKNRKVYFEMMTGHKNIHDYVDGIHDLYFRCLMSFDQSDNTKHDYVSGYAQIDSSGTKIVSGDTMGWVSLHPVDLNDAGPADYNPIAKAAIQFGRMNLPRLIWNQPGLSGDEGFGEQVLTALVNSSFVKNINDAIDGPNKTIWDNDRGRELVIHKSWFRFNCPTHKKLGGGLRVKKIEMSDEFSTLTGSQMNSATYGQEYDYTMPDGSSSGVASYEPQLGGDENPWRQPISFNTENLLAPDDEHYLETPIGEAFFPSASVGYSRVTVRNLKYTNVNRTATGKVVHEFYTSKDYPTIVDRTGVDNIQDKSDPFSLTSLIYTDTRDHMTATQGFSIETNDMSGKPLRESVYQEGQDTIPITSVEYRYKSLPYLNGSFRLDNHATVIDRNGNVDSTAQIGVIYDMTADMRQFKSEVASAALQLNVDVFIFPPLPTVIPVPMVWPSVNKEETQFRSATTTKVIQRFGLLDEVIATDVGSVVSTKNLAYDAETGDLLLTSATTDYDQHSTAIAPDVVYSLSYPAHWYYDGMGQAYRNIGLQRSGLVFTAGNAPVTNANLYFVPGDELELSDNTRGWITAVDGSSITVEAKDGAPVTGTLNVKVIRSGRRNLSSTPIAKIATRSNPLDQFSQNIFNNVLQASAVEFSDQWRTFCDCFDGPGAPLPNSSNPYVLGRAGNWRAKRSQLYLSPRTLSNYNRNTNIRTDGVFTSFSPFYKRQNNSWTIDPHNWTFASEVTQFSPFGGELENRDALDRYSAAQYNYRQTMATGVAANARYRDMGNDNFEDYGFAPCADNHFKFTQDASNVDATQAHTGSHSIKVSNGSPVNMRREFVACTTAPCPLSLSSKNFVDYTQITFADGTGPYQISWEVINGDPQITPGASTLTIVNNGDWTIELTVTDANGCTVTQVFHN